MEANFREVTVLIFEFSVQWTIKFLVKLKLLTYIKFADHGTYVSV